MLTLSNVYSPSPHTFWPYTHRLLWIDHQNQDIWKQPTLVMIAIEHEKDSPDYPPLKLFSWQVTSLNNPKSDPRYSDQTFTSSNLTTIKPPPLCHANTLYLLPILPPPRPFLLLLPLTLLPPLPGNWSCPLLPLALHAPTNHKPPTIPLQPHHSSIAILMRQKLAILTLVTVHSHRPKHSTALMDAIILHHTLLLIRSPPIPHLTLHLFSPCSMIQSPSHIMCAPVHFMLTVTMLP
jgi:hypothetical protein